MGKVGIASPAPKCLILAPTANCMYATPAAIHAALPTDRQAGCQSRRSQFGESRLAMATSRQSSNWAKHPCTTLKTVAAVTSPPVSKVTRKPPITAWAQTPTNAATASPRTSPDRAPHPRRADTNKTAKKIPAALQSPRCARTGRETPIQIPIPAAVSEPAAAAGNAQGARHTHAQSTPTISPTVSAVKRCPCSRRCIRSPHQPVGFNDPSLKGQSANAIPAPDVVVWPPTKIRNNVAATTSFA
jgi:hypothetical protein